MIKKIFLFAFSYTIIHLIFNTDDCMSQWVASSNGMYGGGGNVLSLTNNGNTIFAGLDYYVFLSTNNGDNWSNTSLNTNFHSVEAVLFKGTTLIAGLTNYDHSGSIYISTNNGINWIQTFTGNDICSLISNGNYVFAGTSFGGVISSSNNGISWNQTSLNTQLVLSLAAYNNIIYAGTQNGVYYTLNNGTSWIQTSLNNRTVYSIAANGNNIYAGCYNEPLTSDDGVYVSTNNGLSWNLSSLNNCWTSAIILNGNNIFAGNCNNIGNGVYLSTNNGMNWIPKNQGLIFVDTIDVLSLNINNNYIFAGVVGQGVYRRSLTEIIGIQNISTEIPSAYSLGQNYPNPFNSMTKIKFQVPSSKFVKIIVFDILGKEVATLVNENLQPGTYETTFDASQLTSGIYFYRLQTDSYTETKRMTLVK